jgi:hypothetical protein
MSKTSKCSTKKQPASDDRLCDRCDRLMQQIITCRRRGWVRQLAAATEELCRLCRELGRRIDAERNGA